MWYLDFARFKDLLKSASIMICMTMRDDDPFDHVLCDSLFLQNMGGKGRWVYHDSPLLQQFVYVLH